MFQPRSADGPILGIQRVSCVPSLRFHRVHQEGLSPKDSKITLVSTDTTYPNTCIGGRRRSPVRRFHARVQWRSVCATSSIPSALKLAARSTSMELRSGTGNVKRGIFTLSRLQTVTTPLSHTTIKFLLSILNAT